MKLSTWHSIARGFGFCDPESCCVDPSIMAQLFTSRWLCNTPVTPLLQESASASPSPMPPLLVQPPPPVRAHEARSHHFLQLLSPPGAPFPFPTKPVREQPSTGVQAPPTSLPTPLAPGAVCGSWEGGGGGRAPLPLAKRANTATPPPHDKALEAQ
eukprot:CAMPEP_0172165888 /NCGR_PEP_ID=MMETSP1050-20130122/8665_1 /TAXON_ID=233186 /ORGANISM="Cryptomonas curvata, Strain CCAP979/52" /LENGTH=155 /DNA_ID=CAMNT_0012836415 /DNA_START=160 /DNA_END=626 /DNA_ORIENTATION=+